MKFNLSLVLPFCFLFSCGVDNNEPPPKEKPSGNNISIGNLKLQLAKDSSFTLTRKEGEKIQRLHFNENGDLTEIKEFYKSDNDYTINQYWRLGANFNIIDSLSTYVKVIATYNGRVISLNDTLPKDEVVKVHFELVNPMFSKTLVIISSETSTDTIEGKNNKAVISIPVRKAGKNHFYGKVEDFKFLEEKVNGEPVKRMRNIKFDFVLLSK